jgi:hypothetical protein
MSSGFRDGQDYDGNNPLNQPLPDDFRPLYKRNGQKYHIPCPESKLMSANRI